MVLPAIAGLTEAGGDTQVGPTHLVVGDLKINQIRGQSQVICPAITGLTEAGETLTSR